MKHLVFVELEVEIETRKPRDVDRALEGATYTVTVPKDVHAKIRKIDLKKISQFHHET